jgi:hypothetical protein
VRCGLQPRADYTTTVSLAPRSYYVNPMRDYVDPVMHAAENFLDLRACMPP